MSRRLFAGLALLGLAAASYTVQAEEPELRRYINIRAAGGPSLSPDGGELAFLTNVTGVNQLWKVSRDGGWPEQLTFYDEPVKFNQWSPTGEWIFFAQDIGGAENFQFFLTTPDGSSVVSLTDNPGVRNENPRWSQDGTRIAWGSNQRNRTYFDVVVYDVKARTKKTVFQSDHYNLPVDWSPDGKQLIFSRQNSNFDQDLFLLDLASGKATQLNTDKEDVRYQSVQFAPDGKSVYTVTDLGRDFMTPARIDLASRKVTPLAEVKWDTEFLAISKDGRWMATSLNVDGDSELEVCDLKTNQVVPLPPLPRGQLFSPDFAAAAPYLAVTLSGPKHNPDVWVVDLEKKTVKQVTRSNRSGLSQEGFIEPQVVRYKTFDGRDIPALLYLPKGATKDRKLPAIVKMHGGPEGQSEQLFNGINQYFLAKGYVVLEPNVRGSTGYGKAYSHLDDVRKREDSVKDMGAAAEYLKQSGYVDPTRLAVMGGSYGGYMVLAALTRQPELWAAGIDIVGIASFKTFLKNTSGYRRHLREAEYGSLEKDADFLDQVSPMNHVDKIKAPLLVIQGANDPRVPKSEADQIVEAVKKKGGVVEYVLFPDEGHGVSKLKNRITATEAEAKFLDRHVRDRK